MALLDAALLSLDSFLAGCAVAPLLARTSHRLAAAGLFGGADAVASALALTWLPPQGLLLAAPIMVAAYGAYLLAATALAGRGLRAGHAPGWLVLGALAVALSLDNLLSAAPDPVAVAAAGSASAALLLLGLIAGARLARRVDVAPRQRWLGAGLATTALLAVLG